MPAHNGTVAPVARRSPVVAVILSGLFPGLGQLYNREWMKAVLFLGGGILSALPSGLVDVDIDLDHPIVGMWKLFLIFLPFLVVALWSVIDAYRVAQRGGS